MMPAPAGGVGICRTVCISMCRRPAVSELSQLLDIHPNLVTQWKSQLLEGTAAVFGIAAGDKAFTGEVGMLDLEQVALIEQIHLQRAVVEQGADLAALERRDPAEVPAPQR